MPLTKSGQKMMHDMKLRYGSKEGEEVFYATLNEHPSLKHKMEGEKKHRRK